MYNFNIWRELTSVTVKTVHFVSWKTPPFWNKFSTKPSFCIFIFSRKVRMRLFCYFINQKLKKKSYKITRPDLISMNRQKNRRLNAKFWIFRRFRSQRVGNFHARSKISHQNFFKNIFIISKFFIRSFRNLAILRPSAS